MALPLGDAGTILQKKKSFAPTRGEMVKDVQDGSKGLAVASVCSDTLLLHAENCIGIRDSSRFALADRTGRHRRGTSQLHANTSEINGELSFMTGRESFGILHRKGSATWTFLSARKFLGGQARLGGRICSLWAYIRLSNFHGHPY